MEIKLRQGGVVPYSGFTYDRFEAALDVRVLAPAPPLWTDAAPLRNAPDLLRATLADGVPLALRSRNEKARSEWIIAPMLQAAWREVRETSALLSGAALDVDPARGLEGMVDFLVVGDPTATIARNPIVAVVEAKRFDFDQGLAQCVAAMVASATVNAAANDTAPVYGVVTTGTSWSFYKLSEPTTVLSGALEIGLEPLDRVFSVLVACMQRAI